MSDYSGTRGLRTRASLMSPSCFMDSPTSTRVVPEGGRRGREEGEGGGGGRREREEGEGGGRGRRGREEGEGGGEGRRGREEGEGGGRGRRGREEGKGGGEGRMGREKGKGGGEGRRGREKGEGGGGGREREEGGREEISCTCLMLPKRETSIIDSDAPVIGSVISIGPIMCFLGNIQRRSDTVMCAMH